MSYVRYIIWVIAAFLIASSIFVGIVSNRDVPVSVWMTVTDSASGEPIEGAKITLKQTSSDLASYFVPECPSDFSNDAGKALLWAYHPSGWSTLFGGTLPEATITVSADGYEEGILRIPYWKDHKFFGFSSIACIDSISLKKK